MAYISTEVLWEKATQKFDSCLSLEELDELLKSFPEKDMVEVVRCCDCEYSVPNDLADKEKLPYFCTVHQEQFYDPTEYCCYGKRKRTVKYEHTC